MIDSSVIAASPLHRSTASGPSGEKTKGTFGEREKKFCKRMEEQRKVGFLFVVEQHM